MKRVVVHIDRLVLRGVVGGQDENFAHGLREELARQLADPQAVQQLAAGGNVARLRLGKVPIGDGADARQAGASIGRGIGKGVAP